ncbi:MAG: membrane protein insertion efficiency factor YidD [Bdellovibrionales bacterium]
MAAHFSVGCLSTAHRPLQISRLDANHISEKQKSSSSSTGVQFYRHSAGKTLGSSCAQFPSDSQYALKIIRRCGSLPGTLLSFARFAKEEDNYLLGKPQIYDPRRLSHADLDFSCHLL